jgi:hypothetical protein
MLVYTLTVLPEMLGQFFLMVSHQVSSSPGTVVPPPAPLDGATPDPLAEPVPEDCPDPLAAPLEEPDAAELLESAGALDVAGAEVVVLPLLLLLLLPHAVTISASAPIPAMVATALRAEVRDTRLTSVSRQVAL